MNEDLLKIHDYVANLLKFTEAKNLALLVFNAGALGFIGKTWETLVAGPLPLKPLVFLSVVLSVICILALLLSLLTMSKGRLRQISSHRLQDDVLSLSEMASCTPRNLIDGLLGENGRDIQDTLNLSLASKIAINSRSTEVKLCIADKCICGTFMWVLMLSFTVFLQAVS